MKRLMFVLVVIGLLGQSYAQIIAEEQLSEVVVTAVNYKYLDQVDSKSAAVPVKMLERMVSSYDLKDSELYSDEYETYTVSFFIPEGKIVAAYDKDGKVIRTIEKFKNVKMHKPVMEAVAKRFPGWEVAKDVYLVHYHDTKGVTKKYKLVLTNGDQKIRVKTDEKGNFL